MAPLLGVPDRHHADVGRLGLAFQLTNFLRDVREDWRLDRVYLPADELAAFGVAEADLGRAAPRARCAPSSRTRLARAQRCSPRREAAVAAAPASVRPGIRFACAASTAACSTAWSGSAATCSAGRRAARLAAARASSLGALRG